MKVRFTYGREEGRGENGNPVLHSVIWDPKTSKPLVEFDKGVFETEDKKLIDRLKAMGYKYTVLEGDPPKKGEEKEIDEEKRSLKKHSVS